jgi:hypothetical protein
MNKVVLCATLSLAFAGLAHAQVSESQTTPPFRNSNITLFPSATSSALLSSRTAAPLFSSEPLVSPSKTSASAFPDPQPGPFGGDRDDYRWQLAAGVAWERFRSDQYNASAVGINTNLTYFLNDWLGIDGSVSALFAPTILQDEHVKLVNYGGGPRIAWRGPRWEPFAHIIVGGAHALPQTAVSGRNSFMLQAGGGADYRFRPFFGIRLEAAYLRTTFFKQSQNNLFAAASAVFHF